MTEHTEPTNWIQLDAGRRVDIEVPSSGIHFSELTVEAWFGPFAAGEGFGPVVGLRKGSHSVELNGGMGSGSWPAFGIVIKGVGRYPDAAGAANVEDSSRWRHAGWTLEKIGTQKHRFKFYLDGNLFWDMKPTIPCFPEDSFDEITIGGSNFTGDLAQVRLWNRPLNGQKIRWNMRKDQEYQSIVKDSSLVGWWKLNDLTDDLMVKAPDTSGNGHDGTVHKTSGRRVGSRGQASRRLRGRSG